MGNGTFGYGAYIEIQYHSLYLIAQVFVLLYLQVNHFVVSFKACYLHAVMNISYNS